MMLDMLAHERQDQWSAAKALQIQGEDLATEVFMSRPLGHMPYRLTGDLHIDFDHQTVIEDYHGVLDLDQAQVDVGYRCAIYLLRVRSSALILISALPCD